MSPDAHGQDPDESLVPPAATRWADGDAGSGETEDVLSPPFVPGRQRAERASAPPSDAPSADKTLLEDPIVEEAAVQELEPVSGSEEPFPFEAAVDEPVLDEPAVEESVAEDDFPFDQFDIEGGAGQAVEPEEVDQPVATGSAAMGWSPADLDLDEAAVSEEPATPDAEVADAGPPQRGPAMEAATAASDVSDVSDVSDAAQEAAAILDRLAGRLRANGEQGMRDEMDSPDRITALIAGLLAGYVSGRPSGD